MRIFRSDKYGNDWSALALQLSIFRENRTKYLTFTARWVGRIVCETNKRSRSEIRVTGRHTTTVTLAAHARRGLISGSVIITVYWTFYPLIWRPATWIHYQILMSSLMTSPWLKLLLPGSTSYNSRLNRGSSSSVGVYIICNYYYR